MKKESLLFLPPGKIYTINAHDMHLYGVGQGDKTIVLVPGSGTPNAFTDFYYLQNKLQNQARIVSYDRAGYGWSEETDLPRTIDIIVEELHALLKTANEAPPYILVGHSLASLEVIHFAQKYPNEVQAIVLLDGGSPEYYAQQSELISYLINRGMAGLRVTGIVRALGSFGVNLPFSGANLRNDRLPPEWRAVDRSKYYNHIGADSNVRFIESMNENAQTVLDGGKLTDIPLLILSSDGGANWTAVQQQLLHWSNLSEQVTIPKSSHYIHWSNQEIVLEKIREVIDD